MKGKIIKTDDGWFISYKGIFYIKKDSKVLGNYIKKYGDKEIPLHPGDVKDLEVASYTPNNEEVSFKEVLINSMGRELNPMDLSQNQSNCVWHGKIIDSITDKEDQKQNIIDIMKYDEELRLYDDLKDWDVTVGDGLDELELEETLEEAAENCHGNTNSYDSNLIANAFELGDKWQEPRMYSEEDMKQAFTDGSNTLIYDEINYKSEFKRKMNEWFDQFKKK